MRTLPSANPTAKTSLLPLEDEIQSWSVENESSYKNLVAWEVIEFHLYMTLSSPMLVLIKEVPCELIG